MGKISFGRVNN